MAVRWWRERCVRTMLTAPRDVCRCSCEVVLCGRFCAQAAVQDPAQILCAGDGYARACFNDVSHATSLTSSICSLVDCTERNKRYVKRPIRRAGFDSQIHFGSIHVIGPT